MGGGARKFLPSKGGWPGGTGLVKRVWAIDCEGATDCEGGTEFDGKRTQLPSPSQVKPSPKVTLQETPREELYGERQ